MFSLRVEKRKLHSSNDNKKFDFLKCEPVCRCMPRTKTVLHKNFVFCKCGDPLSMEWLWEKNSQKQPSTMVLSPDRQQVMFHPTYSNGTALAKGNRPFSLDRQHYWEIKILSDCYGTDIMIGLGMDVFTNNGTEFRFQSLLGCNSESYGMSYQGGICHDGKVYYESAGFNIGDIVGVKLDLWHGTLQFYINRKLQDISFYNMRRHKKLFPMISSTAAQSTFRLIYTSSWKASLMTDSAKMLTTMYFNDRDKLPIGIQRQLEGHFWMLYPDSDLKDGLKDVIGLPMPQAVTDEDLLYELYMEQRNDWI